MPDFLTKTASIFCLSAILGIGAVPSVSNAADFTYNTVLPVYLKLDKTLMPEDIVDGYMQTYRPEVWAKYQNDEFELDDKRQETLKMMKNIIAAANPDETFTIQARFQFGEYNFSKEQFDFHPFAGGVFFPLDQCCSSLPRRIKVSFSNPDIVDGIPMKKAMAKQFLDSRKSSGGYVNRDILAKVKIRMLSVPTRGELVAQIEQVQLFSENGRSVIATLGQGTPANTN